MGKREVTDRIISDAKDEAEAILAAARETAEGILVEAKNKADAAMKETRAQTEAKAKSIADGYSATARLDGAKALLAEKRAVIDEIYSRAEAQLLQLGKTDSIRLAEKLLNEYAEEGDEIVFADSFRYGADVAKLKVVSERKLKITFGNARVGGGFVLWGKNSDKDLSYAALLAADRAENEAKLAAELFNPAAK